jgi:hypothetical protein
LIEWQRYTYMHHVRHESCYHDQLEIYLYATTTVSMVDQLQVNDHQNEEMEYAIGTIWMQQRSLNLLHDAND